jgi:hypothetical protein
MPTPFPNKSHLAQLVEQEDAAPLALANGLQQQTIEHLQESVAGISCRSLLQACHA